MIPVCFAILGLCAPCAGAAQTPAANGRIAGRVYVNSTNDEACLELAQDGVCFLRSALGQYACASWVRTNKTAILSPGSVNQRVLAMADGMLVDEEGTVWKEANPERARKAGHYRPATVTVRDIDTGNPVKEFSYDYWIETQSGRETTPWARRKEVCANDGRVIIDAPLSCDLTVCVESPDYISGYGNWGTFTMDGGDDSTAFEIELRRGTTVRGTVTDATGGKPVRNVRVSPIVVVSVGEPVPDPARAVTTDTNGTFVVRGVDPELGINVSHPAYLEFNGSRIFESGRRTGVFEVSARVALEKGLLAAGTVIDSGRNPIEGAAVGAVGTKSVLTGRDGSFSVAVPEKPGSGGTITFTKAGYRSRTLTVPLFSSVVVLEREPGMEVRGKVAGPDGSPVERFEVVLGPGNDPQVWRCNLTKVADSNGCFSLDLPSADRNWIVVRADGFTPWAGWINAGRTTRLETVRLSTGISIRGRIVLRGGAAPESGSVVLIPQQWVPASHGLRPTVGEFFLSQEAVVDSNGVFRIEHVDPGEYVLDVVCFKSSAAEYIVNVPSCDIDLGTIEMDGRGTIRGRVCPPDIPGAAGGSPCVAGEIRAPTDQLGDVINSFTTDENGVFEIQGVSAGIVSVTIFTNAPDPLAAAVQSFTHLARVCAGRTTEVNFNCLERASGLGLDVTVGDGSASQRLSAVGGRSSAGTNDTGTAGPIGGNGDAPELLVRLVPPSDVPALIPEPVAFSVSSGSSWIGMEDIPPGKYRLELAGQQGAGLDNILHSEEVEIAAGTNAEDAEPVWIPLGAGSIKGQLALSGDDVANTVIAAVDNSVGMKPQCTVCDGEGKFCVSFLEKSTYTVWIHSPQRGWARLNGLAVSNNVCDAGEIKLAPGAAVKGELFASFEKRADSYEVEATSGDGVRITSGLPVGGRNGEKFSFANLWPGEWTISLLGDDEVLRSIKVSVEGCKTVEADLVRK